MKAFGHVAVWDFDETEKARELSRQAIERQEDLAAAHGVLAFSYLMDIVYELSGRPLPEIVKDAIGAAQTAIKN